MMREMRHLCNCVLCVFVRTRVRVRMFACVYPCVCVCVCPPPQAVVSGIAIGGVVTSSLSFFAQLSGEAAQGMPTPEDVAPAAFK